MIRLDLGDFHGSILDVVISERRLPACSACRNLRTAPASTWPVRTLAGQAADRIPTIAGPIANSFGISPTCNFPARASKRLRDRAMFTSDVRRSNESQSKSPPPSLEYVSISTPRQSHSLAIAI